MRLNFNICAIGSGSGNLSENDRTCGTIPDVVVSPSQSTHSDGCKQMNADALPQTLPYARCQKKRWRQRRSERTTNYDVFLHFGGDHRQFIPRIAPTVLHVSEGMWLTCYSGVLRRSINNARVPIMRSCLPPLGLQLPLLSSYPIQPVRVITSTVGLCNTQYLRKKHSNCNHEQWVQPTEQ